MNKEEKWLLEQEIEWLLKEKYLGEKSAPVFKERMSDIKNKYSWGAAFFTDCARLESGEPLAYVIGSIPFLETTIFLDSHPLIPRTETEFWVERVIQGVKKEFTTQGDWRHGEDVSVGACGRGVPAEIFSPGRLQQIPAPDKNLKVLDLCAGSGCIGIAVLKHIPDARVDFCEIDARHHPTILKNIQENGIDENRTRIFGGDLFENIPEGTTYNYILTNPPYIDPTLAERTAEDVKKYEPHLALFGGKDGMEYIEKIIEDAPKFLAPGGALYIEHEPEQAPLLAQKAIECGYAKIEHHIDQYGVTRMSTLTRGQ